MSSSHDDDNVAIRVQGLSKCYQIYDNPRDRLKQFVFPRVRRMAGRAQKQYFREFWALRDVSFDIKKGETVGIIGRNGCGKSTLLQMICGTLNPTRGTVNTSGRIAALLELGAGFNPEFTGRENVYMNASVMGVSRDEISARFTDVVEFADIGDFIDQPVKTYSSGMFVRLAFAVAVHVQPDILVVDEALSVGDVAFQNKCMAKIQAIKESGASILFVSHDLSTMQIICDRVIWLRDGGLVLDGDPVEVCQNYYSASMGVTLESAGKSLKPLIPQQSTGMAKFSDLLLLNSKGKGCKKFSVGGEIRIDFELVAEEPLAGDSVFTISVYRSDGDWVLGQTSREENVFWPAVCAGGTLKGSLVLAPVCLAPNDYMIAFACFSSDFSVCYALTDLCLPFSVRSDYQTWGKFIHPCAWVPDKSALICVD